MSSNPNFIAEEVFARAIESHKRNNLEIALDLYNKVLKINPNHLDSLNNMGVIFFDIEKYQKAIDCYKKVIQINPNNADVYSNLGTVFYKIKEHQKALIYFDKAFQIDPNHINSINAVRDMFQKNKLTNLNKDDIFIIKKLYLLVFKNDFVDHSGVILNTKLLLSIDEINTEFHKTINSNSPLFENKIILDLLKEDLFYLILQHTLITDRFLEKLLTKIRFEMHLLFNDNNIDILESYFYFIISLAEQCWLNEYIFIQSEKEINYVNLLKNKIENDKKINELEISFLACFIPLNSSKVIINKLLNYNSKNILFNDLITVQIKEPLREIELKKKIRFLDNINDSISNEVRKQYEENPYPRWRNPIQNLNSSFSEILKDEIKPNIIKFNNKFNKPNVLIAGCGTGIHTISANRYKNANILGVDLSLKSLSYAKRKIEELNYTNIDFLHADILQLKMLNKKFDIIESVGTLHHMKNPVQGLKILIDILEPHGFLKIGLYSKIARQNIFKIRKIIKKKSLRNISKDIKTCRELILNQSDETLFENITNTRDFYSLSNVRDLLFNVQEHCFTVPQISKILKDLNLEFLGFNFSDPSIKSNFAKIFPDDLGNISLDNWNQFENRNPNTFFGMYIFWVRKL